MSTQITFTFNHGNRIVHLVVLEGGFRVDYEEEDGNIVTLVNAQNFDTDRGKILSVDTDNAVFDLITAYLENKGK